MRIPSDRAEEARALMLDLFPEGFEEVELAGTLELAAFTAESLDPRLERLGPVRADDVAVGWEEAWQGFHRPVRVGPLWLGPPWESPDRDAIPVVIDPGRAFGTGAHATTRLCLELLLMCEPTSFLDAGSGSGVLAIAAAKLGFGPVTALDIDEVATEVARANARANGVSIDVRTSDVLIDSLPPAGLAASNVDLASVARIAERVSAQRLIVSGYLASERPPAGAWRHRERREADGWAADLFEADSGGAA